MKAALLCSVVVAWALACSPDGSTIESISTIPDAEIPELLDTLLRAEGPGTTAATERITVAGDTRFVSVLMELIRADETGLISGAGHNARVLALERLTGQSFGADWVAWVEWYGGTELTPPPGFLGFKGKLFGRIDPFYGELLAEGRATRIRVEEIHWGGVRSDGIPPLDEPPTLTAPQAGYLADDEAVFGLRVGGEARAYPVRILDWHELVNDVVGGAPVSLVYCTLCGSALAFDTRRSGSTPYRFSTSGLLFQSNKLMLDRDTRSLWSQFTGAPVVGPLADQDLRLDVFPLVLTTWKRWRNRHPQTRVLSPNTGYERPYRPGEPYAPYFLSAHTLFPIGRRSEELPAKARVFGLSNEAAHKAYPLELLNQQRVVNDRVGDLEVVLVVSGGFVGVEGEHERLGTVSYDLGSTVRAYRSGRDRFRAGPRRGQLIDAGGRTWEVGEDALRGPEGETAPRITGKLAFWFAWYAFHPTTGLYEGP